MLRRSILAVIEEEEEEEEMLVQIGEIIDGVVWWVLMENNSSLPLENKKQKTKMNVGLDELITQRHRLSFASKDGPQFPQAQFGNLKPNGPMMDRM